MTLGYYGATGINLMNHRQWFAALWLILAALFAVCAEAQDKRPEYLIGQGDTIRIQVYQNPDLTLETRVTENGTITFPLIGGVKVGGKTIAVGKQQPEPVRIAMTTHADFCAIFERDVESHGGGGKFE